MRTLYTLCLLVRGDQILLGMKKRGFGAGRWNGFGGKVQPGESIGAAARREMEEECGVRPEALERVGIHEFEFASTRGDVLEVHVFRIDSFVGEPAESEEMKPEWFPLDAIPIEEMWPDDRYWLPTFLAGKKFRTRFLFGEGDAVLEKEVREVPVLE